MEGRRGGGRREEGGGGKNEQKERWGEVRGEDRRREEVEYTKLRRMNKRESCTYEHMHTRVTLLHVYIVHVLYIHTMYM